MLPSCKQVAEQLSENLDQPVTGLRWIKLKLHLLICHYCRQYGKQIKTAAHTINLLEPKVALNEKLKEKLLEHYRQVQRNHTGCGDIPEQSIQQKETHYNKSDNQDTSRVENNSQ
ncbi:hypothetical protein [Aliikangiella maris]|uniref:Zf-HC2 domain-containing protein n=2 Tax=Aliikangiella maris TaxID=3162458 RepID=A0ABV2BVA9_9GAMM